MTLSLGLILGLGAVGLLAAWRLRRDYLLVTVRGHSMAPAYRGGQRLLARRARGRPLQRGDVAVFATPEPWHCNGSRWLVKRVIAVWPETRCRTTFGWP